MTKLRSLKAAFLALLTFAAVLSTSPMSALAQTQTPLALKDANLNPAPECAYTVGGNIVPCHVLKVWNGTAWIDLVVDAASGALLMKTNNGALDLTLQAQQASPGADAAKPVGVQGCTGCKPVSISGTNTAFWNGATGAGSALAASATYTGSTRDAGVAAGTPTGYAYFNAFFEADQAGTASIEASNDGVNWYQVASAALTANTPLILTVPVMTRYHRAKLVNGSSAQTSLWANTSYTAG